MNGQGPWPISDEKCGCQPIMLSLLQRRICFLFRMSRMSRLESMSAIQLLLVGSNYQFK